MKKNYVLERLCCPNCAAKIESAVAALDGVRSCSLAFFTKRLSLDLEDNKADAVFKSLEKTVHRIDMDIEILEK